MKRFLAVLVILVSALAMASARGAAPGETLMHVNVRGKGEIVIKLFVKEAPQTTGHIISLAKNGFYNGQRFYRVVKLPRPYLVQLGAPDSRTKPMDDPILPREGTGTRIPYEDTGLSNDAAGVVGLSNTGDKNAGDSQFYILLAPAKFLDGNYTVFGRVIDGMGVLQSLDRGDTVSSVTISTE